MRLTRRRPWTLLAITLLLFGAIGVERAAAATCAYNPATQGVTVTIGSGETVQLAVEPGGVELVSEADDGAILLREDAGAYQAVCGAATTANTTTIVVLGQPISSEALTLDELSGARFGSITWTIDLGSGGGDAFTISASGAIGDTITLADGGFRLNEGGGTLTDVEIAEALGNGGDDTLDASARTTGTTLQGLDGFDTLAGGAGNDVLSGGDDADHITGGAGDDVLNGNEGTDQLYGGEGLDTCILDEIRRECDPSVVLGSEHVRAGDRVTLTGAGWYPENGAVELSLAPSGDPSLPSPTLDPVEWSITGAFDAPSPEGNYEVVACQPCTDSAADRAREQLFVASGPSIFVDPVKVHVGDVVVVSGRDWDPEDGEISLFTESEFPDGDPFEIVPAGEASGFERRFEIPQVDRGPHTVTACQRCSDPDPIVETATFKVRRATETTATLDLDPVQGNAGDLVEVAGTGWDPAKGEVSVFIDPSAAEEPVAVVQPGSDATFTAELEIPDLAEGSYTVFACQRCDGRDPVEQVATLTVLAKGSSAWWWVFLGALLVGAIAVLVVRTIRPRGPARVQVRSRLGEPEVHVVAEPNGSTHHRIELVPHTDPGVQRVSEGRST